MVSPHATVRRWTRNASPWTRVNEKRVKRTRKANPEETTASSTAAGVTSGRVGLFLECRSAGLHACGDPIPEWEEIKFMVDSGASATVVGADQIKAVQASEPDPSRSYEMADGSYIPHLGQITSSPTRKVG